MTDPVKEAVERLTPEEALERLVVYTAMQDAQLAMSCEAVLKAELSRLSRLVEEAGDTVLPIEQRVNLPLLRKLSFGNLPPTEVAAYQNLALRAANELEHYRRASLTHKAISGGGE